MLMPPPAIPEQAITALAKAVDVARDGLPLFDMLGIGVFAISGALAAARLQQTPVTFAFFALVTGVGGGTFRDLLIGAPVFWVHNSIVPLVCLLAAAIVWLVPVRRWPVHALDWFDAIGLAAYAVFGTAKALAFGIGPLPAMLMGVITACLGGIIRDVLAGEPSILLRPELYVTAAAVAALTFVGLLMVGIGFWPAATLAALAGFALRGLAMVRGLALPTHGGS